MIRSKAIWHEMQITPQFTHYANAREKTDQPVLNKTLLESDQDRRAVYWQAVCELCSGPFFEEEQWLKLPIERELSQFTWRHPIGLPLGVLRPVYQSGIGQVNAVRARSVRYFDDDYNFFYFRLVKQDGRKCLVCESRDSG